MSFSANNFTGAIQPQLSSYLHEANYFQKNYGSQQTPAHPLLHPAAVAAMAAAAAGYSQFGARLNNGPLNLTSSLPAYRGSYNYNEAQENRGPYYPYLGLQAAANPYSGAYNGDFNNAKFPFSSSQSSAFPSAASEQTSAHPFVVGLTQTSGSFQSSSTASQRASSATPQRVQKSQAHKTLCKNKLKKAVNSQEMADRKRQEFDELVKARTDKLLASSYTSSVADATASSGPSANVVPKDSPDSPNYKKLIEAVLDAKTSALLRSPSVMAFLETQQRSLAEFKRQTEMFCCVDAK